MGDLGDDVVKGIYQNLDIDKEWSTPIARGFAWWGHRFRQRIWTTPGFNDDGIVIHRLFAVTDAVCDIQIPQNSVDLLLSSLGELAIGSALVFSPPEKVIRLWSSVTIHQDISPWMGRLFASFAIIQLIEAEQKSEAIAKLVDGKIDQTSHPTSGHRGKPDQMLTILDAVFRPKGSKPSPWMGNPELVQIKNILNSSNSFSMVDEDGLTAEFQFGNATSMMRILASEPHPIIGSGVALSLNIPMWGTKEDAAQIAGALNRAEADRQSMGHLLGSWFGKTVGDKSIPAFSFFVPAALYQPGLLTNLVFSFAARARWVGSMLNPGSTRADVLKIVSKRFQQLADLTAK